MKIGTLTFHRACNYGGALQCFALIKALRKMGYDAEVVDYRNPVIEKTYSLISFNNFRSFISSLLHLKSSIQKKRNFRKFAKQFIPMSSEIYRNSSELSNKYDYFLIGSDQVWSKRINKGFDPAYWGLFEGNKISYAASMGTDHNYTQEERDEINRYLEGFSYISTREDSLRDELSQLSKKSIETVIDPTLLLDRMDYESIAIKPKEDNYVLYYQMEYHPQSKDFVANVAKTLGCKVITIMGPNEKYEGVEHIHKKVSQVNVREFVGLILNAECVIASSFHGTALPIAMRKNFYFLANNATDRSENLLRHIGALDRMKKSTELIKYTSVDYSVIEHNLNVFVNKSKEFLLNCLRNG